MNFGVLLFIGITAFVIVMAVHTYKKGKKDKRWWVKEEEDE